MIDLNTQDSIKRMLAEIRLKKGRATSESTRETYFIYIRRFCDYCGMTPDERARAPPQELIKLYEKHYSALKL